MYIKYIFYSAVFNAIGAITGYSTADNIQNWYIELTKPVWQPPNWVFAPVWTVLYTFLGIIAVRVYAAKKSLLRSWVLVLFIVQLLLNFLWSPVFFGFEQIGIGLVIISVLVVFVLILAPLLRRVDKLSFYLFLPYVVWVCFACLLNLRILQLN